MSGRVGFPRELLGGALVLATVLDSAQGRAGGFELPDNGTQAVGRGTAFVAKADDPTAIYYNPAGLARQRGTNLLVNGNILFHSFEFARLGQFADDPQDSDTPWGQAAYPVVTNAAGPYFVPFVAVASDFGYFDRLTFAAGVYGPPTIGNRTFPLTVESKPAASRYDYVQSRSSILFPTASVGVRATPWLDFGLSTHFALASFDQTSVSYFDLGKDVCKNLEYFRCDSLNTLSASGATIGATLGAMARPLPSVAVGASFRTPFNITASGQLTPEAPPAYDQKLQLGPATYALQLPWMLRVGGRYIGMDAEFELYDLELDIAYEAWGIAQGQGPITTAPKLGAVTDVQTVTMHGYQNTLSVRGGGAYNIDTGDGLLSLRAGAYFETPSTSHPFTRLDFDTLAKIGGTFGVGYHFGSFSLNLGYAAVASVPRVVGNDVGQIRPANLLKNGDTIGADDEPLPAVNEGSYRGFTHIVSLGVSVSIESFLGPQRPIHYGNEYEPHYVAPGTEKPAKNVEDEERTHNLEEKPKLETVKIREEKNTDDETDKRPDAEDEKKPEKKKPPVDDEKRPSSGPPDEEKKPAPEEEKKPKPPVDDERKPEKKPEKKAPAPPVDVPEEPKRPPEKPPEVKKPPPPPEKPPKKRHEWWEESD